MCTWGVRPVGGLLLVRLTLTTWLSWCLLGFSTVTLLFFLFLINTYLGADTLKLYKHPVSETTTSVVFA